MDSDEAWREVFQRSVAEMDVPESRVDEVISSAGARVRQRQRIRAAMPIAAMAAAALTVAGIAGASHLLGQPGHDAPVAAPTSASTPNPPLPSLLTRLKQHLSATGRVSALGHDASGERGDTDWLRYDDGRGPAAVAVIVERGPGNPADDWACEVPTCTLQRRPDGSAVMTEKSPGGGYQQWTAKLGRPDGVVITLIECNSDKPKGAVTRHEPPLSTAQLTSIVIDLGR